ncbi:MAG TPA: bifunctional methylenetetrahydrofolate dehydrogenase/methenyltetrahydrofolate cyclohydrolase FolD [Myxococcaceae bacterium]|nr:bifunctional methylenetetrahydrofolate dehydrogenase/methenyltetrahydrofolate cyclohydrolase FolD [Myxococcaceae bacterium]
MARRIDGKAIAADLRAGLREKVERLKAQHGIVPGLTVVRVGEDPASKVYVGGKKKAAAEIGFNGVERHFPDDVTQETLLEEVRRLNADPSVHGMLLQLPLPRHLDPNALMDAIEPHKDADGFHVVNAGLLSLGRPGPRPCTPAGVMKLIAHTGLELSGKRAVVVGRSNIVGKPMALMLLAAHATVTICHSRSDLAREIPQADVVVAAVGVAGVIRGEWIKPGAVVIDVGMNRDAAGRLVGDVEFEAAEARAGWITPVPGGVGPMTIAMLMQNTYEAALRTVAPDPR